jgi:FixJ family two-component response regulator
VNETKRTNRPLVVLVEDDPAVLHALAFAFETEGYDVDAFARAEDVLERLPLGGGLCLVIDEKLPRLKGLDLLALLRERGVSAPAIIITSNPPDHTRRRAAAAGVEIVEKPLMGDALAQKVRAALARAESQSEA